MANKPLKTLNFGGEDTYFLKPEWENIENKPFGETTVMSDTLTWDGNTDGLYSVAENFWLVSTATPTLQELLNGGSVVLGGYESQLSASSVIDASSMGMGSDFIVILGGESGQAFAGGVALKAGATAISNGATFTFEKAGTYLLNNLNYDNYYTSNLTVNNYTFTETEIKPLDIKFLPESHQFGETITMKDAITWDGNTDGLYSVLGMFYKVSNAIPTLADLQRGGIIVSNGIGVAGVELEFTSDHVVNVEDLGAGNDCIVIMNGENPALGVALKKGASATLQGVTATFEETGVFFLRRHVEEANVTAYVSEFTINNYQFVETEVKTIDPKYLPNGEKITFKIKSTNLGWTNDAVVSCDKSLSQLQSMAIDDLNNVIISWENESGEIAICQRLSITITEIGVSCTFGLVDGYALVLYSIIYMAEGIQVFELE